MQLLIPLAIFLVLSFTMIVLVAKFKAPTAKETVEALCDAILRNDIKTQQDLTSFEKIPESVSEVLNTIKSEHTEQAKSYGCNTVEKWDSENAAFEKVQVDCGRGDALVFECRSTVDQWLITSIKLKSSISETL